MGYKPVKDESVIKTMKALSRIYPDLAYIFETGWYSVGQGAMQSAVG